MNKLAAEFLGTFWLVLVTEFVMTFFFLIVILGQPENARALVLRRSPLALRSR